MRTGANIALQGLNTITHPLMPELMRFLHEKQQEKMEASFGTIWGILIACLAPMMVLVQAVAEPVFHAWTKGTIVFNPTLFALLSLSVLTYAFAQPAIAIVRGNNILKKQVYISVIASALLIAGIYTLVPLMGMPGAGLSLLLSETVACIIYMRLARNWLSANALRWPVRSSLLALSSVIIAAILMAVMISIPSLKAFSVAIGFILFLWNGVLYYYSLPVLIRNRTKHLFNRIKLTNYL
jgi:O-antigen/teichoic acid export membrane protein